MKDGWREVQLKNISASIEYGYTTSAQFEPVGPKFLRITDIQNDFIDWYSVPYCRINDRDLGKYRLNVGDLCIARTGASTGQSIIIKHEVNAVFASYLIRFRVDRGIADPFFVDFVLRSSLFKSYVQNIIGGSAQPNANAQQFGAFKFWIPPLPIQRRIANILGALDDKIECNRRINQTLEQMAQALYKHWFVDSSESETRPLTDFIEIDPTIRITKGKEIPFVEMKALPNWSMSVTEVARRPFTSGSKFQNGDTLFARITPCLENGKTAFIDFLEKDEGGFGSTEFIVLRAKRGISPQFVYCCARDENLRAHAIQSMVGSSGRQRVRSDCFSQFGVKRFSEQTMRAFQERTSVWFDQIRANIRENQTLAHTRDYLLPKLLLGEIEVKDAENCMGNIR